MSETDFLKLKKHDNPETNTDKFDIENYLNGNWDKINENAKKVNTDILNINSKNKEQDTNIEQLQENTETSSNKIAKLEKELKEAQEDFYQNSIRGQASGEYIHVEDSSNCRAKIGIGGNHVQDGEPSPDHQSEIETVGSNVNIFDGEIEKGNINYQNGNVESATDRIRSKNFIEVDPNFQYTINRLDSNGKGLGIRGYDKDKNYVGYIGVNTNKTITFIPQTYSNTDMPHPNTKFYYMKFIDLDNNLNARYKIEKGIVATGYSEHGQGSIKVTKCNKNIMPILNLGNNYEYTENGIKSLKRNDGVEVTRFKVRKGQTIKIGLKMISRPAKDSTYSIYFKNNNNQIAAFAHINDSSYIELNKVYEKSYTANEDGEIFIKLWGNTSSDIFEFQLWAELDNLTEYEQHEEQSYIMPVQKEMLVNDYLDYDNEEEVHVWGKKILDGTENWAYEKLTSADGEKNNFYLKIDDAMSNGKVYSNAFVQRTTLADNYSMFISAGKNLNLRYQEKSSSTEFKAYLKSQYDAGTPVVVYYQLATPKRLKFTDEQKAVAKELNNARTYKNVTNITTDSKAILSLDYAKDLETLLNNTQALAVNNASEGV